jgi:hypothetical protein
MIGRQRIQVGLPYAGKTAAVTEQADTYQITVEDGIALTVPAPPAATSNGTRLPATQTAAGAMASARPEGAPLTV